jgi:hypothetical protein
VIFIALLLEKAYSDAESKAIVKADQNGDKQIDRVEFRVMIDEMAAIGAPKGIRVKRWGRLPHGLQPR